MEEGKQWNIELSGVTPEPSTFKLRLQGDTLINNITYKKIFRSQANANSGWFQLEQYLREDAAKKVYLKTGPDPEFVIYNFNLNKGDFIALSQTCGIAITQVDSITLSNGSRRRRLKVESSLIPEDMGDFWIEGIGSSRAGLLTHFAMHCQPDYGEKLQCFYESNGLLVYPENPPSCFTSAIRELKAYDQLNIYPNPVNEFLTIDDKSIGNKFKDLTIYNTVGTTVLNLSLENKLSQISISNLPKGIYFLLIKTNEGQNYSKRIIKL